MPLRRKKTTVRESLEDRASVAAGYAEDLGHKISEQAPVVRDQIVAGLGVAADQARRRLPELVDRLPDQVSDRLPESVQPPRKKKRRLRKVLVLSAIAAGGAVAYSKVKNAGTAPAPTYTPPPPADTSAPTPVPNGAQRLAEGAAPDVVQ